MNNVKIGDIAWEFVKDEADHMRDLIVKAEEELVNMRVQEHIYQIEYQNPKHIGKQQAMDGVALYQKRQRHILENLIAYQEYCKFNNIAIEL